MSHPFLQTRQEIYEELRDTLSGRIAKLTNFTDRSFNYVWTQAFSQEIRELQELTLVSELAGFIDYTGGPVDEDDIQNLDLEDDITAERVNELMLDEYLDEYVKIVGISRDPGAKATGEVTFQTQSSSTGIPEGTIVSTSESAEAERKEFATTEAVSTADGVTTVTQVSIQAIDQGTDFNVPANTIVRISNPPVGVTGVTNPESTTGGADEETNEELRERAKASVSRASEGGTVEGIKAYIRNNIEAVEPGDVVLEEFTDVCPPFVDVIVDGGLDLNVSNAIEFSRPAGIRHNLIRPEIIQVGVNLNLLGEDINTTEVSTEIEDFLLELGIGDNFYEDQVIREIMLSDSDILNIDLLQIFIERVTREPFEYDTDIDAAIAEVGGSLRNETAAANDSTVDDMVLLPNSPATGDAYYFGSDTIFSQFDLDITTAGAGTWDIVWEYYDGSSWSSLNNVTDGTSDFQIAGRNTISFDIPSDWSGHVVDQTAYYFVRGRLNSFSSISTQPLSQECDITGRGHTLDFTFEDENGTVTIEDDSGDTFTKGTDFIVKDRTGDGYPETLVWDGVATPDEDERFTVDYDVTVAGQTKNGNVYLADEVRDEIFQFNLGQEDTFSYNNSDQEYELSFVPFDSTVTVVDENSTTFRENVDWQLAPLNEFATQDTFTFDIGTAEYTLSSDIEIDNISISDVNDNIYVRGTDYRTIDTDADAFDDNISWDVDVGGAVADDGGTQTTETAAANDSTADDITLLPSSPATGDTYYFGHSTQFSGFDLNVSTAGSGTWDIVWEYYNGTSWVSLSNVIDDTNDFRNSGRNSVEYTLPTDWSTTSVNGISGLYWVRGRLDTFSSITTQPLGQEVEIGRKPDDTVDFTVSYDAFADFIQWDQSGEDSGPPQDDQFTVTYDQLLYETELEIVETPFGEIRDAAGTTYEQDVEYDTTDFDRDKEREGVLWSSNPSTLKDGEEFYFSYFTEGDVLITNREKVDPGTISTTVE